MLAYRNRVVSAADYRATVRHGHRFTGVHVVMYAAGGREPGPVRFGFIVSKAVAPAVGRNLIRRRLKSIAHEALALGSPAGGSSPAHERAGVDVVLRALPGAAQADWATLSQEVSALLAKLDLTGRGPREAPRSPSVLAGQSGSTATSDPRPPDVSPTPRVLSGPDSPRRMAGE